MLYLPERLYIYNVSKLIQMSKLIIGLGDDRVAIDARALRYVDPAGLCTLGCVLRKLDRFGIGIELINLDEDMVAYLERMNLFRNCRVINAPDEAGARRDRTDSLVELRCVATIAEVEDCARRLAQTMVGAVSDVYLDDRPDEMTGKSDVDRFEQPLQYVLGELLENALTHARARGHNNANAWVAAQYYPKKHVVRLAVVDDGCGFRESLRGHPALAADTHFAAIEAALQPRVSRNREVGLDGDPTNQGVGLTVTRQIALSAGGSIALFSGDAWLLDHEEGRREPREISSWEGVGVFVELDRERLRDVNMASIMRALPGYAPVKGLKFEG